MKHMFWFINVLIKLKVCLYAAEPGDENLVGFRGYKTFSCSTDPEIDQAHKC